MLVCELQRAQAVTRAEIMRMGEAALWEAVWPLTGYSARTANGPAYLLGMCEISEWDIAGDILKEVRGWQERHRIWFDMALHDMGVNNYMLEPHHVARAALISRSRL